MSVSGRNEVDYVIIGAGSAGCVLADRLTADTKTQVLLLEAGGWDSHPLISIPIGAGWLWKSRRFDWGYSTEPELNVGNKKVETARGKVVGGSHSINAMAYVRGNSADYDRWAALGLTDWSYRQVLPYFKRSERWALGENAYRGGSGPLAVRETLTMDPACVATLEAARTAGFPFTRDYNGDQQEGFGICQWTIDGGRRSTTAKAFLRPALERANLDVQVRAHVSRIIIENGRAVGIEYLRGKKTNVCYARREVVLCAGAINSPQILMLSGIGDPQHLQQFGIKTIAPLKDVGRNLGDHFSTSVVMERKQAGVFLRTTRVDRMVVALVLAWICGKGAATDLPSGIMGFIRSSADERYPDIQYLLWAANANAHLWIRPFRAPWQDTLLFRPVLLRPESRGKILLRSPNPLDTVKIHKNFLSSPNDLRRLRAGIRSIRKVISQPALSSFVGRELSPGIDVQNDDALDRYIRSQPATAHHPAGTCRMGVDAEAVVNSQLKVNGVPNLRVVDASVMPDMISGNINAAVIMIAEKAAEMIIQDARS